MIREFKYQLSTAILSCPIVYIPHFHYSFVDEVLGSLINPPDGTIDEFHLSASENVIEFDCGLNCVVSFDTKKMDNDMSCYDSLSQLLRDIVNQNRMPSPVILLVKNCFPLLLQTEIQCLLSSFAYKYENGMINKLSTIILVSPVILSSLPDQIEFMTVKQIEKYITVIDIKAPTKEEILSLLSQYRVSKRYAQQENQMKLDLCRALQGLQLYEIKQILYSVLIRTSNSISSKTIRLALEEKENIVKKTGIIEVVDSDISFHEIGGLQQLRDDLEVKSKIYHKLSDAEKYNVTIPKGILIIGMPGCGKSMIAKATARLFEVPLIRLDVSRLMGKYVGESEANLRLALATAEAAQPCVLWIDEIEKAFAGTNNSKGDNDMLVMRMMGHFLTWMQERKTPVYIIATANDAMKPEFMRKGRFDDVYFVNFPNQKERAEILQKKINCKYKNSTLFDFSEVGDCMEVVKEMEGKYGGFSGAEIECVLNMVVEAKFSEYLKEEGNSQNLSKIIINKEDFNKAIIRIKDSVMANQQGKKRKDDELLQDRTSIERIIEMNNIYHFTNASKTE